jgi:hypothetical protein
MKFLGVVVGGFVGYALAYFVLLDDLGRLGTRMFWNGLSQGEPMNAEFLTRSVSFGELTGATVVGAVGGLLLARSREGAGQAHAVPTPVVIAVEQVQANRKEVVPSPPREPETPLGRGRVLAIGGVVAASLVLIVTVIVKSADAASEPYAQCAQLEKDGKLVEARAACSSAVAAGPNTPSGSAAAEKLATMKAADERRIAETLPASVTYEWCQRLRARLDERLVPEAKSTYPSADSNYIRQTVHDNLDGVEVNCRSAVGKTTKGLWECRWNEHFDNYKDCDKIEADALKK